MQGKENRKLFEEELDIVFETPQPIILQPGYVTLHWKSKARYCVLSSPVEEIFPPQGIKEVEIRQSTTLFMQCYGMYGKYGRKRSLNIDVDPFRNFPRLQVGPTRSYKTIQSALMNSLGNVVVEVDAGVYKCPGSSLINKDNIKIVGVGGQATLDQ